MAAASSLNPFRGRSKKPSKPAEGGVGGEASTPEAALAVGNLEDEKRRVLSVLLNLAEAMDGAMGAMGLGTETVEASEAGTLAAGVGKLAEAGQRLTGLLETDYDQLRLPALPKSLQLGLLSGALNGVKEELAALKGEAMQELQQVLDGTKDTLADAFGEIDDDALSATCLALDHPICGLLKDVAKEFHAKSKMEMWHVREVATLGALRAIEAIDRALQAEAMPANADVSAHAPAPAADVPADGDAAASHAARYREFRAAHDALLSEVARLHADSKGKDRAAVEHLAAREVPCQLHHVPPAPCLPMQIHDVALTAGPRVSCRRSSLNTAWEAAITCRCDSSPQRSGRRGCSTSRSHCANLCLSGAAWSGRDPCVRCSRVATRLLLSSTSSHWTPRQPHPSSSAQPVNR